jgi:hypothetical protein
VAGEANLPYYLAKGFPYDDRRQVKDWTQVARYVRETDPFHRPLTIHPTGIGRLSARNAIDDVSLLDIDMLQTPHGEREAVGPTVRTVRESYADKPTMPVINGEAAYEMLMGRIPAEWARRMFWVCMMNGAAGHTYGANGIWQCNRRGEPHGKSPHGGNYGTIPWDEAMKLPGSQQVAYGKKLLEQYAWQEFRPHPEWAAFEESRPLTFDDAQWIWFPEGKPAENAPAEKRFFRRTFVLPEDRPVRRARLRVSADDAFSARLNGQAVGDGAGHQTGREFNVLRLLKPGTNVLAVRAENKPFDGNNPAGLIVAFEAGFEAGEDLKIVSDGAWRCAVRAAAEWDRADFDDRGWHRALPVGRYGAGPWGPVDPVDRDAAYGPQSSGIADVVRIIYVPEPEPVLLRDLGKGRSWKAFWFDPVSGERKPMALVKADEVGSSRCPPPAGCDHDWVLILE